MVKGQIFNFRFTVILVAVHLNVIIFNSESKYSKVYFVSELFSFYHNFDQKKKNQKAGLNPLLEVLLPRKEHKMCVYVC